MAIVGRLIFQFGNGWEDEIPSILKSDLKSLTIGEGDTVEHQPLNMQQRVIQSGLDSLAGPDATDIVSLFKGMAVFAEDQIVPVAMCGVLWVSIDPEEHEALINVPWAGAGACGDRADCVGQGVCP